MNGFRLQDIYRINVDSNSVFAVDTIERRREFNEKRVVRELLDYEERGSVFDYIFFLPKKCLKCRSTLFPSSTCLYIKLTVDSKER